MCPIEVFPIDHGGVLNCDGTEGEYFRLDDGLEHLVYLVGVDQSAVILGYSTNGGLVNNEYREPGWKKWMSGMKLVSL